MLVPAMAAGRDAPLNITGYIERVLQIGETTFAG